MMNDQAVTVGAFLKAVKGCERLSLFDFECQDPISERGTILVKAYFAATARKPAHQVSFRIPAIFSGPRGARPEYVSCYGEMWEMLKTLALFPKGLILSARIELNSYMAPTGMLASAGVGVQRTQMILRDPKKGECGWFDIAHNYRFIPKVAEEEEAPRLGDLRCRNTSVYTQ